jgi:hypothetical protein
MTNPTRAELIRLGTNATLSGELRQLRERVHLSRNAQAQLMEVTPDALRRWEEAAQGMNSASALRVGEWVWGAQQVLASLDADTIDLDELVPLSMASQHLAMSAEDVLEKCQSGALRCEDLGVLGVYIHRSYIPSLEPRGEIASDEG